MFRFVVVVHHHHQGDLERLRRYWFQGACKQQKEQRNISKPLDVNQFMSAFLLLGCGILLTMFLLCMEHIYFRVFRQHLAKVDRDGCFTLVSLVRRQCFRTSKHFTISLFGTHTEFGAIVEHQQQPPRLLPRAGVRRLGVRNTKAEVEEGTGRCQLQGEGAGETAKGAQLAAINIGGRETFSARLFHD